MNIKPLPRSLDPLPHESIRGYLLRLSCRLGISPAHLAIRTGLIPPAGKTPRILPLRWLFLLEATARGSGEAGIEQAFAQAARLMPSEVTALYLNAGPSRPRTSGEVTRHPVSRTPNIPWTFTGATRWCPQCLAGDGSPLQRELGGAWRKQWHMPVVFACTRHRRLLDSRCLACGQPATHQAGGSLVENPAYPSLNPVQCRMHARARPMPRQRPWPACGNTLANASPHAEEQLAAAELHTVLQLQLQLLTAVGPDAVVTPKVFGTPVTPHEYLNDLAVLTGLIMLSWPATAELCEQPVFAEATDLEVERRRAGAESSKRVRNPWISSPEDPLTCAALLGTARGILNLPSPDDASGLLHRLQSQARQADPRSTETLRGRRGRSAPFRHLVTATRP